MKRKIYQDLLNWKNQEKGKSALLIEGARRVGKSYIVREFAQNEYKSYVIIDFKEGGNELKPLKEILNGSLRNLDELFLFLKFYSGMDLVERDTLIVFDEVQDFPRAREAIKFLVQDGRYDYIETGSLISIKENVKDIQIPSEEYAITLNPMDFEEFLWAQGQEALWEIIKAKYNNRKPLGNELHRSAMLWFRKYLIVGGMPQAVAEFANSGDLIAVDKEKRMILQLYQNDFKKHDVINKSGCARIFDNIPSQLQKHEKKFSLSTLHDGAYYKEVADDFFYLKDSKIVNIVYNSYEPSVALNLTRDGNSLKCYMADTGLLISQAFEDSRQLSTELYRALLYGNLTINEGMLIENVVAQMLVATGRVPYYFSRNSRNDSQETMEIDFLITKSMMSSRHNIHPIEVKSGKNYTYTSLNKFYKKFKDYLSTPYIIHESDYKEENGIIFLPLYMTPLL